MTEFIPDERLFAQLKDKVVVITGGATGIGAATVKLLAQHGASIVMGDTNVQAASQLLENLPGNLAFAKTDVSDYNQLYALCEQAFQLYGKIDHAISCAGIFEQGNWFDPNLTIESVKEQGNTEVLDVNVLGTLNFARIASVFMREGGKEAGRNKSLTLLSSVNAFRDSPGLYLYQMSKHAIQGLLRSTRKTLPERDGIRVNAVCPGVTDTAMTAGIIDAFKNNNLFWQSPESVAKIILGLATNEAVVGKAVYVEGGEGWEFEDSLYAAQSHWLGEEATRRMRVNSEAVQKGILTPRQ
ncbi:hypothetical protein CKM354_000704800 [Cercospora kikuchii]|uniref:Uncharacterized protein n=1 Tax=Cercospora kikuchii TaxID=84275 RepID=A0A9P3CNR9_9PEZI|nr:uncharacterized protein CKM354_000704800 [Cercospora kikuchii]GIZ43835.1 hypothetical protein CKM354_000704800 [Cercospora kikuchii]